MNEQMNQAGTEELERRARAAFDASVDSLDGATLSRLNRSRQSAVEAAAQRGQRNGQRRGLGRGWSTWAPAGALAAGVLAAALLLRAPGGDPQEGVATLATAPDAIEVAPLTTEPAEAPPLEVVAAGDEDFAIATAGEDLEFYGWVELAAADAPSGQTG